MDFSVRQAGLGDGDSVRAMLTAQLKHNGSSDADIENMRGMPFHPDAEAEKILAAAANPEQPTRCWLAQAGDETIGIITTKDVSGGVYVLPAYRRQGIGTALACARDEYEFQGGKQELTVHIKADNADSLGAFQKLDYYFNAQSAKLVQAAQDSGLPISGIRDEKTGKTAVLVLVKRNPGAQPA